MPQWISFRREVQKHIGRQSLDHLPLYAFALVRLHACMPCSFAWNACSALLYMAEVPNTLSTTIGWVLDTLRSGTLNPKPPRSAINPCTARPACQVTWPKIRCNCIAPICLLAHESCCSIMISPIHIYWVQTWRSRWGCLKVFPFYHQTVVAGSTCAFSYAICDYHNS